MEKRNRRPELKQAKILRSLHWTAVDGGESAAILNKDGSLLPLDVASELLDTAWEKIAGMCARRGFSKAYIYAKGTGTDPIMFPIPVELAGSDFETVGVEEEAVIQHSSEIMAVPETELTISRLEEFPLATYINAMKTQKKFYANPVALNVQGKPPEDFLQGNAYDLNDPEELEKRCSLLALDGEIIQYEYRAWRWYFDGNAGTFRLKEMDFISNFRLLQSFCGVPCWMGQVLVAEEQPRRKN